MNATARRACGILSACLLLAATVLVQNRAVARRQGFRAEDDTLYLPRASALALMSLGHRELAADLVFIRALIYYGSELGGTRHYLWLDNYLDTIVALDPNFELPYRWAGVATIYTGNKITNDMVKASSHFLALGLTHFPDDWRLAFMLGCNYLFELHTDDPAQKAAWRKEGAAYIQRAALDGGGPPWLAALAATMLRKEGEDEAALRYLETVYRTTQDPAARRQVLYQLRALHAKVDYARIDRERRAFEDAWHATVPYASADLFVAIGAAPSPRMDLSYLSGLSGLAGHREQPAESL